MKKILILISTLFVILLFSVTCFATNGDEIIKNSVYAKYSFDDNNIVSATIENGNASIFVHDGFTVQVTIDSDFDGYVLVIRLMRREDSEAYDWIKNCIPNGISFFQAYDIYLLTSNNGRVELPKNTVITMSGFGSNSSVIGVFSNSKIQNIKASYEQGCFTFNSLEKAGYYVIGSEFCLETNEPPKTGNSSLVMLWISLLFFSGCALICMNMYNKRCNSLNGKR